MPRVRADDSAGSQTVRFDDRLLAEAVRALEQVDPAFREGDAIARAQKADGNLETRIVTRAAQVPAADRLRSALHHVRVVAAWLILAACIVALVSGATAARAALGGERDAPVIVLPVLGALLGVQLLLLLLWLTMWLIKPRALSAVSLGGLIMSIVQWAARLGPRSAEHLAAIHAHAEVMGHRSMVRWITSAISHAMWTSFNVGCLALLLLLLSARDYTFAWETTILPDATYTPMIRTIAWLPEQIGFPAPTAEQVADSRWTGSGDPPHAARTAWSGLLIGSIVIYGAVPRSILLIVSLFGVATAQRRFRLDITRPGYVRLRHQLMPGPTSTGIVDRDHDSAAAPPTPHAPDQRAVAPDGSVPIIGIEIPPPASGWPPPLPDARFIDLGIIESRPQRDHAMNALRAAEQRPSTLVAVCSLTSTPDRGLASLLSQLSDAAGAPLTLVLTGGQTLRQREPDAAAHQRVQDWHRLGGELDIDAARIIDLDLDHATDASLDRLAAAITGSSSNSPPPRRIEQAFAIIAEHARSWDRPPDDADQLALHTAIAREYRQRSPDWMQRIRTAATGRSTELLDIADQAKTAAQRTLSVMPGRLRSTPAWAIAGATAGAIGCLAVASLVTPAALAALPGWSAVGGALTAITHAARQLARSTPVSDDDDAPPHDTPSAGDAVRAATLFALLLELQGRDESVITAALDQTLADADEPPAAMARVDDWLDTIRHRFDIAIAAIEGAAP